MPACQTSFTVIPKLFGIILVLQRNDLHPGVASRKDLPRARPSTRALV